jgi:hypothetical protein
MTIRLKLAIASVVAFGLISGPSIEAFRQEVLLRYRWTKGTTTKYRFTQQSATTISGLAGMGDMTVDQTLTQLFSASVQDVAADGTATIQQVAEAIRMDMTTPMGRMTYDSASPEADNNPMTGVLKAMFSAMIGEPLTLVAAPNGTVKKLEGFTRLAEKMFKSVPQDPASAAAMNSIKGSMNDEAMRGMIGQGFSQLADRPVKPGDTWSSELKTVNPMLGGMVTSVTSTLKAVEGSGENQIARVTTRLSLKRDPAVPPSGPSPMGMTMELGDSAGDGELVFNVAAGRLQSSVTRMTMPMKMTGQGPDGSQMNLASNVKSTITVEVVK